MVIAESSKAGKAVEEGLQLKERDQASPRWKGDIGPKT